MIIEFTGPTGVGKSSCLAQTARVLEHAGVHVGVVGHPANSIHEIPDVFAIIEAHNWKTDLWSLPWAIIFMLANPRYAWFVFRAILASNSHRGAITRAVLRKFGIYRYLTRPRFRDRVILVDEGIVHVCHNILVSVSGNASNHACLEFARLTPSPTMVVFLDAPQDVLVERLNSRGDLSPRIRSDNELDTFVQNASCLFSVVAPAVLQRTLGIYIDTTKTGNAAIAQIVATKINEITNIDSKC